MAAGGPGRPKTGSGERPYSVSKDEAYARMLQEEEYSARVEEDEQLARRMQQDMMLGMDNSTDSDDNQQTASSGDSVAERRRKRREERRDQPMHRMMTPITELFTTLVMGSMRQRHPYFFSDGGPGQEVSQIYKIISVLVLDIWCIFMLLASDKTLSYLS